MSSSGDVLVMGGRGRVGREVIRALCERGASVRSLVREPSGRTLSPNVREVLGDLADRASLDGALAGVAAAFFVTPHAENEERLGRTFVDATTAAGARRIVFASAYHADFTSAFGFSLFVGAMGLLTHYGPKLRVERRVRRASTSPVVLMPSNFYQNDAMFLSEIQGGRYPQPLGTRGANRVDCRDIGDAAARALLDEDIDSGGYPLVGPEPALTGPQCAAVWASALGREVTYDGDLDRWRALVDGRMQPRERDDFGKTYKLFGRRRVAAKPAELARTTALLGRPPRSYATYVSQVVADRVRERLA
jgi:uncharacterized protein YbjT (DUF2867 family)